MELIGPSLLERWAWVPPAWLEQILVRFARESTRIVIRTNVRITESPPRESLL